MGGQRASRHWAGTAVLRENLDFFFLRYDYGPNAAAVPSGINWGQQRAKQSGKAKQSKDQHFDTFELADAYRMHRGRGHEWFQTVSPFQTHAASPGESRMRRRTLKASLKRRKYQNLKVACKAFAKATATDLDVGGPDGASEKVRGAARRPARHNLGSFLFFYFTPLLLGGDEEPRSGWPTCHDTHFFFRENCLVCLAASQRLCQVSEHREN